MREIEIKARVINRDALLAKLKSTGIQLGAAVKQRDVVYNEPGATEASSLVGYNFLRVRIQNDEKATFTLKQTIKNLDKLEHETDIANADEMITMMQLMHYELFNDLTKVRRKAKFGEYEVCFDEVENLGTFIEVEKLCPDDVDGDVVREELWQLFEDLGITREEEVTQGYDVLMRQKLANG